MDSSIIFPQDQLVADLNLAVDALKKNKFQIVAEIFEKLALKPCQELMENIEAVYFSRLDSKLINKTLRIFAAYMFDTNRSELSKKILENIKNKTSPFTPTFRTHSAPPPCSTQKAHSTSSFENEISSFETLFKQSLEFYKKHQFLELYNQFVIISHTELPENFRKIWDHIKKRDPRAGECLKTYRLYLVSHKKEPLFEKMRQSLMPLPSESISIRKTQSLILNSHKSKPEKDVFELLNQVIDCLKQKKNQKIYYLFEEIAKVENFKFISHWIAQDGKEPPQSLLEKMIVMEELCFFLLVHDKAELTLKILDNLKEIRKLYKTIEKANIKVKWKSLQKICEEKKIFSYISFFYFSFPKKIRKEFSLENKLFLSDNLSYALSFFFHPKISAKSDFASKLAEKIIQITENNISDSLDQIEQFLVLILRKKIFPRKGFDKKTRALLCSLKQISLKEEELSQLSRILANINSISKKIQQDSSKLMEDEDSISPGNPHSLQKIFPLEDIRF